MASIQRVYIDGHSRIELSFRGKEWWFPDTKWALMQLQETFNGISYDRLECKDKIVIDLGSNIGDTAIYFLAQGAKKVYGFDCDPAMVDAARETMKLNHVEDLVTIFQMKVEDLRQVFDVVQERENIVIKMDVEGSEVSIFKNDTELGNNGFLNLFSSIIMEYHVDPYPLMHRLYDLGFFDVKRKECVDSLNALKYFGYIYSGSKHEKE